MEDIKKRFLIESEHTGRFIVYSIKTGKKYYVETIDDFNRAKNWGDVNPVTKKVEGSYGEKYKGSINENESLITAENGFDKIYRTGVGVSPISFIEQIENEENTEHR